MDDRKAFRHLCYDHIYGYDDEEVSSESEEQGGMDLGDGLTAIVLRKWIEVSEREFNNVHKNERNR